MYPSFNRTAYGIEMSFSLSSSLYILLLIAPLMELKLI